MSSRNPLMNIVSLLSRSTWMQRATIVLLGISLGTIAREVYPPKTGGSTGPALKATDDTPAKASTSPEKADSSVPLDT